MSVRTVLSRSGVKIGGLQELVANPALKWESNFFRQLRAAATAQSALMCRADGAKHLPMYTALANIVTSKTKKVALSCSRKGPHSYEAVQRFLVSARVGQHWLCPPWKRWLQRKLATASFCFGAGTALAHWSAPAGQSESRTSTASQRRTLRRRASRASPWNSKRPQGRARQQRGWWSGP